LFKLKSDFKIVQIKKYKNHKNQPVKKQEKTAKKQKYENKSLPPPSWAAAQFGPPAGATHSSAPAGVK
jgi:hypothetical protein